LSKMFRCAISTFKSEVRRGFSTTPVELIKVSVLGAAGGIGQPLSLLLKTSKLVDKLFLYDVARIKGVEMDLSHINTKAKTRPFAEMSELPTCLCGSDVVVIPAGVPRKPGMSRDDLFNTNAKIIKDLSEAIGTNCPKALVAIISNPVNSLVPLAAEVLKKGNQFDPKRLFGVTTLDVLRANTFVAQVKAVDVECMNVPVIGGHAGKTIIPLISQAKPTVSFTPCEIKELTEKIQEAGTDVVKAKEGTGSATLSMAYAAFVFVESLIKALKGECDIVQCSYVFSGLTEAPFFASKVKLGKEGVEEVVCLGELSCFEKEQLDAAIPILKKDIQKGVDFAKTACK